MARRPIVRHRSCMLALLVTGVLASHEQPTGRDLVTSRSIDVGVGNRLCLAVDVSDERGIWSWEPGSDGCASRSTVPAPEKGTAIISGKSA